MLILHQRSPVRGQSSLLKVREHVEEMYRCDELDNGVAKELEPLVVFHLESTKAMNQSSETRLKVTVVIAFDVVCTNL